MKTIHHSLKTILLAIILSFGVSFVYSWTGPTTTPPAGNTTAPINTSTDSQYKNGALGIGGLLKGYSGLVVNGQSSFNSTSGITHVYSGYNDGTKDYGIYQWQDAGTAPVNYFQNNVGIGTTNPTQKLEIGGTAGVDGIKFPDGTIQTTAGGKEITTMGYEVMTADGSTAAIAICSPNKAVTGGGCWINGAQDLRHSFPTTANGSAYDNAWYCGTSTGFGIRAFAICVNY